MTVITDQAPLDALRVVVEELRAMGQNQLADDAQLAVDRLDAFALPLPPGPEIEAAAPGRSPLVADPGSDPPTFVDVRTDVLGDPEGAEAAILAPDSDAARESER